MNKYSLSITMATLLSFNVCASPYAGLNVGINTVTILKDLSYPLEEVNPASARFNNAYTNFHGQFLAGYQLQLQNKFSAALEVNADWFTGNSKYKINNWYFNTGAVAQEQLDYGFALFLLPSYQINKAVSIFAGPGISYSHFLVKTQNTAGNIGVSENFNKWLTGGGLKVGSITQLNNHLDLLLTYQFTQYESVKRIHTEPLSEETLKGNYKPHANTVLVGFKIHIPEHTTK